MVKKAPNDPNLQNRQNEKLEEAYKKELAAEVTNPLQAAIDLMALDKSELDQWVRIFQSIDVDKIGKVNTLYALKYEKDGLLYFIIN